MKHKYNNFIDERTRIRPKFYTHPEWCQGHLYENIDEGSAFTGDVYLANSTNTLVSLQTGYIWNDEMQFESGKFKDVTSEVWLCIVPKGETDE
tara:strand:+ start:270 stop:548 length:279 start_codon:yes stop_codon:yes gene_type:complete